MCALVYLRTYFISFCQKENYTFPQHFKQPLAQIRYGWSGAENYIVFDRQEQKAQLSLEITCFRIWYPFYKIRLIICFFQRSLSETYPLKMLWIKVRNSEEEFPMLEILAILPPIKLSIFYFCKGVPFLKREINRLRVDYLTDLTGQFIRQSSKKFSTLLQVDFAQHVTLLGLPSNSILYRKQMNQNNVKLVRLIRYQRYNNDYVVKYLAFKIQKVKINKQIYSQSDHMNIRLHKKRTGAVDRGIQHSIQAQIPGTKEIQRLIKPKIHLWLQTPCPCLVCKQQKPVIRQQDQQIKEYKQSSRKSHQWLKKILMGLTDRIAKSLKLYLPDIFFVVGNGLQIYSTNKKDSRITKFVGMTPVKAIYSTMVRLRKEYKGMLQQNFRKTMIDKIDPRFMHIKYYDKLLPSHFHDGDGSVTLSSNKQKFKTYILHNNQKYILSTIQEHKMNQKQPFATIRYSQGNFQLLNQKQFELFAILKIPQDVVYVQSYIKSKQAEAIVTSTYTQNDPKEAQFNAKLWRKAQVYVLVLLGGLSKYDQGYEDLQNFQDQCDQLMKQNPQQCAKYMTYLILHFLAMASNIYIRHIKIKWIINDIQNLYLQEIIEFDLDQIPKRPIRFKMPPNSDIENFYSDPNFFVEVHRQMRKRREESIIKVKRQLQEKTSDQLVQAAKTIQTNRHYNLQTLKNGKQTTNIYKRLGTSKRRRLSNFQLDFTTSGQNELSICTKTSKNADYSKNYSTINTRRSLSKNRTNHNQSVQISKSRKQSVSPFKMGEAMTRYEKRMVEMKTKRMDSSLNRYKYNQKQESQQKRVLGFQMTKSKRQQRATLELS